jgi:hypothetical protein
MTVSYGQKNKGTGLNTGALDKNRSHVMDEYQKILDEAKIIKDLIFKKINSSATVKKMITPAVTGQLNDFMGQIEKLLTRKKYIDKTLKNENISDIENRIKDFENKFSEAKDSSLKEEYKKSIHQATDHKEAFDKMLAQREIINLKINSAITSLKQLQLSVANMDEVVANEESFAFREFQNTSKELSEYVSNLQKSYQELL